MMDAVAATLKITAAGTSEVVAWSDDEAAAVDDATTRNVGNSADGVAYRAVRSTRFGTFESITGESLYL
jgi:hypothetical protein